jgi:hypothetical protein
MTPARVASALKSLIGKYITYQAWLSGVVVGAILGQAWIIFLVWLWLRGPFVGGG